MKAILKNNDGIALPIVVVIIAIISLLGFTAVFLTESQTSMGGHHEKSETTLSIAEAGVNKYLWHLNKDSKFYETTEGQNFVEDSEGNPIVHSFQNGKYTLEIEAPTTSQPVVKIKSTGWLNADESVKTAIEVRVHKRGFTQYVHLSGDMLDGSRKIYWCDGEQIHGPIHTNGYLRTMGSPAFHDRVTYTQGIDPYSGVDRAIYLKGNPEKVAPLVFPTTNDQLKEWADPVRGGYFFEGRTCIYLNGSTLKIRNPNVNNGDTVTLSLPASGVIYVGKGYKSWPKGIEVSGKWGLNSGNVFISGTLDGRLTIAAEQDIYITGSDPTDYYNRCIPSKTNYNNASIFYTNTNINSSDSNLSDDMLGLIANGNVRILHYDWPSETGHSGNGDDVAPGNGITIYAAIFALDGSYGYESYFNGHDKGYINFFGSLTQHRMCATFSKTEYSFGDRYSGYRENNTHDPRLLYDTPPHFLDPENAGWEIVSWKRVTPSE